jgi:hypothetical protein
MNDTDTIYPSPSIGPLVVGSDSWTQNRVFFEAQRAEFLKNHRGKYVAVHDGKVVAEGDSLESATEAGYRLAGYVPIYVDVVTDEVLSPVRMPSPLRVNGHDV